MPKAYSEDSTVWLALIIRGMNSIEIAHHLFYVREISALIPDSVAPKEHRSGPDRMLSEFEQLSYHATNPNNHPNSYPI